MSTYLRYLLLPFSLLYGLVILIRNKLFDVGILKSSSFDLPIICIGNLAVGGSGKTPVVEYVVRLLEGKRVAILSRGYGRATSGFVLADRDSTASSVGDEPLQYYHKFKDVTVAVCEDRIKGINLLKDEHDVILLDDAFQHRKVRAGLNILLFEYVKFSRPQFLMPAGNLREPFQGFRRSDLVIITKSPFQLQKKETENIRKKFGSAPQIPVLFSYLNYQKLRSAYSNEALAPKLNREISIHLLTGIANPDPLVAYLKQQSNNVIHHEFSDHHQFSLRDISDLVNAFNDDSSINKLIITTEKDAQRLLDASIKELLLDLPLFYLPIRVMINESDRPTFDQKILNYVSSTTRNR
ncbi:tetraacyldisaccharide 4'-kinase [Pedobacter sp. JCM 36344]|uniref:tetraacyldisaccharide 4'-kinase n=1 Tax=Pedobacter sp. JCM 36344 TaxID=3374280 RepID=UPI00397BEB57